MPSGDRVRVVKFCGLLVICWGLFGCATPSQDSSKKFVAEKLWIRNTLKSEYLGHRLLHRMTPIVTEQWIIQGNAIDGLTVYDRKTARQAWRMDIRGGVEAGAALVNDVLYFAANDGKFYAVDFKKKNTLWSLPIRSEGIGAPTVANGVVYFIAGDNVAYAVDTQSGKTIWSYNRRDGGLLSIRGASRPTVYENAVYMGFSDGALVALDKSRGSVIWEQVINKNRRFRDVDASPVIENDRVYIASYDGALYCLNRADGRILWNLDDGGDSAPLLDGRRLYYSTSSGRLKAVDKKSGKQLWSKDLGPSQYGTRPVLYQGVLAVGEYAGALKFFDNATGKYLGQFEPGRGVTSSPHLEAKSGELFFISADANLFALKLGWKSARPEWPWEATLE